MTGKQSQEKMDRTNGRLFTKDEYEKEYEGNNLLDYDKRIWYNHDFQNRLNDLSLLIFGEEPEQEQIIDFDGYGFSNLVPMVCAELTAMAIAILINEELKKN